MAAEGSPSYTYGRCKVSTVSPSRAKIKNERVPYYAQNALSSGARRQHPALRTLHCLAVKAVRAGRPAGKKRRRRKRGGAQAEGAAAAPAGLAQPAAPEAGARGREAEAAGSEASCAAAGEAAEASCAAAGEAAEASRAAAGEAAEASRAGAGKAAGASCRVASEAVAAVAEPGSAGPAPRDAAAPPRKPKGRSRRSPAMGTPEGADRVAAAAAALAAGLPALLQDTGARQRWLRAQGDVLARALQGRDTGSLLERLSAAAGALPELQAR